MRNEEILRDKSAEAQTTPTEGEKFSVLQRDHSSLFADIRVSIDGTAIVLSLSMDRALGSNAFWQCKEHRHNVHGDISHCHCCALLHSKLTREY